jgi:UDP-N-acetylmuramyl pentapeptide phosphotransferase/UDP-N-acetylglucosamine-1-phosphate transferase
MTIYLLVVFLTSLILGTIFTPAIMEYCKRKKLYDIPNERKNHKNLTPRLGGVSFCPSMLLAFILFLFISSKNNQFEHTFNIWSASYLAGLFIIYTTGIIDDLIGLTAKSKFVAQIIAASLLPMTGLTINNLYGLFGIYSVPYFFGVIFTIFAIVFVTNAINLIDESTPNCP